MRAFSKPGISRGGGFQDTVTQSSIFVDKSLFIKEITENKDEVTLITMPRRWGKSVNLEMLSRFLTIEVSYTDATGSTIPKNQTDNYKLFMGETLDAARFHRKIPLQQLKIAEYKDIISHYLGQFPVINMEFSCCKQSSYTEMKESVISLISDVVENFCYLKSNNTMILDKSIKSRYEELVANLERGEHFENSIRELCMLLCVHHGRKVWILIDEYETPVNYAYLECNETEAKQVIDLFRNILEPALQGNEYLAKSVITGVQRIVKSGPLSGLKNLKKYSVQDYKYSQHFAVNQNEMDVLLSHFNITNVQQKIKIKDWYNGYRERNPHTNEYIDKYNIWSIIGYLNSPSRGYRSYWGESGGRDFTETVLKKKGMSEIFDFLIDGGSITFNLHMDFSDRDFKIIKDIDNLDNNKNISQYSQDVIFSYFYLAGYLTKDDSSKKFKIPNQDIKRVLSGSVLSCYSSRYAIDRKVVGYLTDILENLFDRDQFTNDEEKVTFMKKTFLSQFQPKFKDLIQKCRLHNDERSIDEIFENEDVVHGILNCIGMKIMCRLFYREDIYPDMLLGREISTRKIPDDKDKSRVCLVMKNQNTGLIIEIKYKSSNVSDLLTQAKSYENLISDQKHKIFIGIYISASKEVTMAGEIHMEDHKVYDFNSL